LRLPYGKETSPIDSFPFEEMPEMKHSDYLWGNPAFLCVSLLAQAFESSGWDMKSIPRRVDGLPIHIYREDGEPVAKPCAEVLLTHSEAIALMEAGVMPLVSIKGQDAAMIPRFQSVADPLQALPL
jgi:type VI secretion system protein ImpC